jgi:hypothetical protein
MVYRFIPSEPHLATDNELVRDILLALLHPRRRSRAED